MRQATLTGLAAFAAIGLVGCGASTARRTSTPAAQATGGEAAPGGTTTARAATQAPKPKPKPDPGTLPQTNQLPSADTRTFRAAMAALWRGVTENSLAAALPAFFPEKAYAQVKQIADPRSDYTGRLLADYRLDLGAAHALLGTEPAGARLLRVEVPGSYAHWVDPGACYNGVGYYEVPNARVVYRQNREIRSFGIASMISWRGVWYVVHLGAILRNGAAGVVDDPSTGTGESAPSSTC